ncbi:hypothetical protein Patl1_05262 [Pistacia atlantica]|uniref:Uncharacterized protein n=1 Tax=Pistacia atlantica TaxID=434234 RepID=A0ACC1BQB7_9ROSI|nr:hypothetical protein Patl1_05262 [Pistacia atlantica]
MINLSSLLYLNFAIDLATLSLIILLLLFSLLSLCLIFYLRFRTQSSNDNYLDRFNAFWTVRLLLVIFIIFWTLNELLRIPFFRIGYIYPFFTSLTLSQQDNLCKIHLVLSLGLLEPGFLVTLLFLLHVSIKQKTPRGSWAFAFLLATCLPISLVQFLFVFFQRLAVGLLPNIFLVTSTIVKDGLGGNTVLCAFPLFSTALFGAFGIVYCLYFMFSCWSVISLVINKTLRVRIRILAFTVLASIGLQVLFLGLSVLWEPKVGAFGAVAFLVFLSTFACAVVGEVILVIIPIIDSLAVRGDSYRWNITHSVTMEDSNKEESL